MDEFLVVGDAFEDFMENLSSALQRYEEFNLIINQEKCHFMVNEDIILEHNSSTKGIKVGMYKIVMIKKLPPPISVKGVRSFLRHESF